ncbi:hypothetical protein [Bradyrhizobium sp. RT3b]|uniref:hypothetical protein n=1 Tax=Bradyrhizobium sp. RT3b TaxID=3156334 RepID=UPI00339549C4
MPLAFSLLIILLATAAATPFTDGIFVQHTVYLLAPLMLLSAATAASLADLTALTPLRRFILAAVFPMLWMVTQIAPLPFSLVNPIWPTTAVALNEPSLAGRITVDLGNTLRGLMWYSALLSLLLSTILLAKDRKRAEVLLVVLTGVATFIVLASLSQIVLARTALLDLGLAENNSLALVGVIAALANTATIAMAAERQLGRAGTLFPLNGPFLLRIVPGIAGLMMSLAYLATLDRIVLMLTALGFAIMLFIAAVRRLGYRSWPSALLAAAFIMMAGAATLSQERPATWADLLVQSRIENQESVAIARRAISDSSWTGNGVGTFAQVARIYQDYAVGIAPRAPSTAALVAIEWGRLALPILALFGLQLFFFVLRGAVGRGRDSFFASTTCALVLVAICESFVDTSMLNPAVQIILAGLIGLGLAQSTGRTSAL